ncbi:MAG TPA: glycoside hydrolase domain-containing protein, partial [Tepidisphaeraceae bacterium]|nr:glycoside hydrolase domain-containing protein [Tepidisphaeraceae bacterium]
MKIKLLCTVVVLFASIARAQVMSIREIVEERFKEDDSAAFDPHKLEFNCAIGQSSPWGFGFAGFETTWKKPIELEVAGSGQYTGHDMYSIVGVLLDYGTPKGWASRSIFGLGLIQPVRGSHPPGWGSGAGNQTMRGDLIKAKPDAQRTTIDPAKFAPSDWDGRLWIGVMIHNAGAGQSIRVRIVNATSDAPAVTDRDEMVRQHQKQFLTSALKTLKAAKAKPQPVVQVVPEMAPYLTSPASVPPVDQRIDECQAILAAVEKSQAISAQQYLKAVENYFAWTNATPKANEAPQRINAFFRKWEDTGKFGSEIKCIIRTASNLQKIGLDDVTHGAIVPANPQAAVELSAARHEYEGFQIVLTPLVGSATNVKLVASDLKGAAGTIPASNIKINPVGYLWIRPNEPAPDPLLLGDVPALKPGENQPIWISIYVPPQTRAGEYAGAITLSADSKSFEIPYALRVRSFEIPRQISLRSSFWMFRDQINRFYHLNEVKLDDYLKWIDFALEHRVNPIDVYEGHCQQLVDIQKMPTTQQSTNAGGANPTPDFTKWDKYIDRMVAGGANTIHLGTTHHFGNFFQPGGTNPSEAQHLKNLELAVKTMADHYKQRGVFNLHYLQLRDETSEPASLNVYRDIYEKFPDAKLLLTAPSPEARPLLRIPCPLSPAFEAT